MLTLNDGRKELYQWDTGRTATVDIECDVVHFSNLKYGESLAVEVKAGVVSIPNKLLMIGEPIYCWAFVADENGNYTKQEQTLNVNKRAKPSDYVYTETETLTWKSLDERITELEKGGTGGSDAVKYTEQALTDGQKAQARTNIGAVSVGEVPKQVQTDWDQKDNTAADYLKNKPFYLEKTLVVELTKDDFTVNDQGGYIEYIYRSTPKLDWFTSAESIAFEIEIVDTNGRRYTATQDSIDLFFENDNTDDGYEYWDYHSRLFSIVSGIDLDFYYDEEYYYKDEWGVLVNYGSIEFSGINIKIYRVDVKKIPEICLDAAIGKTAITVGSVLEDSEAEMSPTAIVPDLRIQTSPSPVFEEIYCDRISKRLRISGNIFPYIGIINYTFQQVTPTTAGSSIYFDISSEGDTLWDTIGSDASWRLGAYLTFRLVSSYSGGGAIEFMARGNPGAYSSAVASSNLGHLYTVVFEYTNSYKTLNVTIKCVV